MDRIVLVSILPSRAIPLILSSDFPSVRANLSVLAQPLILHCRSWQLFPLSVLCVQIWLVLTGHRRGCFPARTTQLIQTVRNKRINFSTSVIYTFILSNGIFCCQRSTYILKHKARERMRIVSSDVKSWIEITERNSI